MCDLYGLSKFCAALAVRHGKRLDYSYSYYSYYSDYSCHSCYSCYSCYSCCSYSCYS